MTHRHLQQKMARNDDDVEKEGERSKNHKLKTKTKNRITMKSSLNGLKCQRYTLFEIMCY